MLFLKAERIVHIFRSNVHSKTLLNLWRQYVPLLTLPDCRRSVASELTFGTGVLHLIQINHQLDATILQFIILTLFTAQHVSGVFPPIIRNSMTAVAACGFTFVSWWQSYHQPDATIFQFITLTFVYSSTSFGRFPAHHQELNDCSGSLWFYLRIVVTVVLCSWSGRPA